MIKNSNRVPKKVWKKWSKKAKEVFNLVYAFILYNPTVMTHPKQEKIPPYQWKTLAWNSAWIAADAVDNTIPDEVI